MSFVKVRERGQITIPREVREATNLEEGDPIQVEIVDEGILLRPKKIIDASQAWFWTNEWLSGEQKANEDIEAGRGQIYESDDDFLAALDE